MWKLYIHVHSSSSRIYDMKTLCSKHIINCKCITLDTNKRIYRTTRGMSSCPTQCQHKNTVSCACVNTRTLMSAVQQCQCKNTVNCASVNTRTLLSNVQQSVSTLILLPAVHVSLQEHYCQLCNSVSSRTLLSAVQVLIQNTVSCTTVSA